jgi:trypsin-like peptidase
MLTYSPVKLRIKRRIDVGNDIDAAIASGFLWQHDGSAYLITNWHNVTGLDPINGQSLSKSAIQPTHVELPLLFKADTTSDGRTMLKRKRYSIPLYNDGGVPSWLEHSVFGNRVDVVAIKIAGMDSSLASLPVNSLGSFVDFEPQVGDDVFVLGYPGGVDGGHELAIWKRGSIASQPSVDIDQLPKILVDTATRKGMSGAPVIVRRSGIIVPRGVTSTPDSLSGEEIIGQADTFLGVYSGRIGDDPMGLQLGIVWKASVIDEIVKGGLPGQPPYP